VLALATVAGTVAELAARHHWGESVQLIAWAAVAVLVVAIGLAWTRVDDRTTRIVRILAALVMASALIGMVEHVIGNYDVGPLDAVYGDQWESMSETSRWWAAVTQAVGPSPALAPGVLVLGSAIVWLATMARRAAEHARSGS